MDRLTVNQLSARERKVVLAARSISETKRFRYLLGLSSPAEREHIESEYFEDEDAFQQMLTAEDDLIDAYARGELGGDERRRFEENFVGSLHGRDRVAFARAFAGAVSANQPIETKPQGTLRDVLSNFLLPRSSQATTIVAIVVLIATLAGILINRRRMANEPRALRAESAALNKQAEAVEPSSETKQEPATKIVPRLADLRTQPDKPRHRERRITATQLAPHVEAVRNGPAHIASSEPEHAEILVHPEEPPLDTTVTRSSTTINETTSKVVPARKFEDLLTLTPGVVVPGSLNSIRFRIRLETPATHEGYGITIQTADGRHITSVSWIEPLTSNQTFIDTPIISTADLPAGDYVLLLTGKDPNNAFIKLAECPFKVVRY